MEIRAVFTEAGTFDAYGRTINLLDDDEPVPDQFSPDATLTRFTLAPAAFRDPKSALKRRTCNCFPTATFTSTARTTLRIQPVERAVAGTITAAGLFNAQANVNTGDLTAGTSIYVGGNLFGSNFTAGTTIFVGGSLSGFGTAMAGGDITANSTAIPTITSPNGVLRVGDGGIRPFVESFEDPHNPHDPPQDGANLQHTITVDSIISTGGIDFSGNQFGGTSGLSSGGLLTINARTLRFDSEDGIADVNFNGADANAFGAGNPAGGGDGGVFRATTTGNIYVGSFISATTGQNDLESDVSFSGKGGTVSLDASHGMVTVNSSILVSSNDHGDGPLSRSASGGNISIHSGLTNGTAISLGEESQLLSLLSWCAPGPGGAISVISEGGDIFADGEIIADRGTITISNHGSPGRPSPLGLPPAPLVSLGSNGFFSSEIFNVISKGDIQVGDDGSPTIDAVTISLSAQRNISGDEFSSIGNNDDETVFVRNSSGNVSLVAGGSISLSSIEVSRTNHGATDGLNLTVSAGLDLEVGQWLALETDASGLTSGGNILVNSGRNFDGGRVSASTYVGSDAGSGANITLTSGGWLNALEMDLRTRVDEDVSLQSGANITVDVVGNLNITGPDYNGFTATVDNQFGHITSGGNILVRSSNGSILGAPQYNFAIYNTAFDTIDNGGNITVNAFTDFKTAQDGFNGGMTFHIENENAEIGTGGNISVTVGGMLAAHDLYTRIDSRFGGSILNGGTINFQIGSLMQIQGSTSFVIARDPLQFRNVNGAATINLININADTILVLGDRFDAYVDDSGGSGLASGIFTANVSANSQINVEGVLNVLGTVHANGPIIASTLSSTNVSATGPGAYIRVGDGGIQPFMLPGGSRSDLPVVISSPAVSSNGGINLSGESSSGFNAAGGGGNLTLNVHAIAFGGGDTNRPVPNGPITLPNDLISGPVGLGGGAGGGYDQFENELGGGDGGVLTVNADSDIEVHNPIDVTTGLQPQNFAPSGNGGSVTLNSDGGTVTVDNRILVSSNDPAAAPTASPPPRRRSARGGNITLKSGKSGDAQNRAVAINVTSSAQLLSLLAAAPTPRPGGKVTILATGANSDVNISGAKIQADGGTIDIRHNGDGGNVNIAGTATLSADVIKAGAFGANGSLTIGNSTLNADTLIRLYAPSSNGQLIFVANTTLSGGSRIDLAANTITINPQVVVTISGNAGAANVYTNNPNYSGFGGNNPNNGTFSGNGAHNPQPLSNAPPFDSPPSRPTGIGATGTGIGATGSRGNGR